MVAIFFTELVNEDAGYGSPGTGCTVMATASPVELINEDAGYGSPGTGCTVMATASPVDLVNEDASSGVHRTVGFPACSIM
jgi:DNA replication protein DnaC